MEFLQRSSLDYLLELRTRLLLCCGMVAVLVLLFMPFSNFFYHLLAEPLLHQLPQGSTLIATAITASFFIPLKFTMFLALVLAIPFVLYQFWMFIAPALYQHEKRWIWLLLLMSTVLFYTGMTFAYAIVFPLIFKFFVFTAPVGVKVLPDIGQYLDLVSQLFLAFGLAFEVPIVIIMLNALQIVPAKKIAQYRRYFIVLAFIVAMLITPPDVISQSLLAVPLCLLFEIGLLLARYLGPITSESSRRTDA